MWSIITNRQTRLIWDSTSNCLLILVALIAAIQQTECKDILSVKSASQTFINKNITEKESISFSNDIISNNNDDDNVYVGYGGYLRSNSSILAFDAQRQNFSDNNAFRNNKTSFQTLKSNNHQRSKRGVTHLYNMILCATGCNPLAYKGYGCYCGFLGSGYPMDGIDRCCKMHDWCYDATECPMFVEYFVPYYWKCYHGYKPICAIEHGEWGGSGSCAQRLCECDRMLAECLRRYRCPRHKAVCTSSPWRLIQNIFMII